MRTKSEQDQLSDILEELEAVREAAASLERLRGVLVTRFRTHPNTPALALACHQCAQRYMARFDREALQLLNRAWFTDEGSQEVENAEGS